MTVYRDAPADGTSYVRQDRQWIPASVGGATQLTELSDVVNTFTGLTDGHVLTYDSVNGWQNEAPVSGVTDHTLLTNIGTNTHAQIDTHLALANEHIDWTNSSANFNTSGRVEVGSTPSYANLRAIRLFDDGVADAARMSLIATSSVGNGPAIEFVFDGNTSRRGLLRAGYSATNNVELQFFTSNAGSVTETMTLSPAGNLSVVGTIGGSNLSGTNTGDEAAASTTVAGVVELATQTEVDTGTDTTRAVTPSTLANYSGLGGGNVNLGTTYPASNLGYYGTVATFMAGGTITAGYAVVVQTDTVKLEVVHADADILRPPVGIALESKTSGSAVNVLIYGVIKLTGAQYGVAAAEHAYASTTAGYLTGTAPTLTGDVAMLFGYGVATDVLFVNPQLNWVTVA